MKVFMVALLVIACSAFGQNYTIQTFAGGALPPDNTPGPSAGLGWPTSVAVDSSGNLYVAVRFRDIVVRLDAKTGLLTRVAGTGTPGFNGDNIAATASQLNNPSSVAVDSIGNVYIADTQNNRVRKVARADGMITTVAGDGTFAYNGDDIPGQAAQLRSPYGVAVDGSGNVFIADSFNNRIRKVSSANGVITTVAGDGTFGYKGDNIPAIAAQLNVPNGVAVDAANNVYIADNNNQLVRKVSASDGTITTVAGTGASGFNGDNIAAITATLYNPQGVTVDSAGNIYIADAYNGRIRKVSSSDGTIQTVAGSGAGVGYNGDYNGDNIAATSAQLDYPPSVTLDSAGNLYIADTYNNRIRKVSNGIITTVAGDGTFGYNGDGIPATSAQLSVPSGAAVDSAGNLYFADAYNNRIRKVSTSGVITTVAGTGIAGYNGDHIPAASAQLNFPQSVALDSAGNLYIAEYSNNRVRKVSTSGMISTVAGTGTPGYNGDGIPAAAAQLSHPESVAVDSDGNVYIADWGNYRVRKVYTFGGVSRRMRRRGYITTIAGTGTSGYNGENILATGAQLLYPQSVAVDSAHNVFIGDSARIRKVSSADGRITTVAGNGNSGYNGDNIPAITAEVRDPNALAVDSANNLYVTEYNNERVRKISASTGLITTLAGTGVNGYNGDNIAACAASLSGPNGVAVDSAGKVYIADEFNQRVRVLIPSTASCP